MVANSAAVAMRPSTYARDRLPTSDFTLERSIVLRRTADEVLHEFSSYNDAYIWYLATTYIPLALEFDPSFGGAS